MAPRAAAALALAAYAWLVASLEPFSAEVHVAVLVPGVVWVVAGSWWWRRVRRHRDAFVARSTPQDGDERAEKREGLAAWAVVVAAVLGWELANYFQSPRADHPTASAFLEHVMQPRVVQAGLFAAWAVLGWHLVRR